MSEKYGYHKRVITKGEVGEISKIREELEELEDAMEQGIDIMALVELSDLVLAIDSFIERYFESFDLDDVILMADATRRAFENGFRTETKVPTLYGVENPGLCQSPWHQSYLHAVAGEACPKCNSTAKWHG